MKKAFLYILAAVTALAVVFTLGFRLGQDQNSAPVQISLADTRAPAATASLETRTDSGFPVNINTAGVRELMLLPGIGEVFAQRIVAYRDTHGPFQAPEELMNVEGIGEKRMEELLELVTIGG